MAESIYDILPPGCIRLISVHEALATGQSDGSCNARVAISLRTTRLEQAPAYDAVSYVWGDPGDTKELTVSDSNARLGTLTVTRTLLWALARAQKHTANARMGDSREQRPRYYWADGICINQQDWAEKSAQVGMMAQIYGLASRVLVCLPPPIGLQQRMSHDANVQRLLRLFRDEFHSGDYDSKTQVTSVRRDPARGLSKSQVWDWEALLFLVDEPWFHRVWVVQEVGLADQPIILFDDAAIPYRDIMSLINFALTQGWSRYVAFQDLQIHQTWHTTWLSPTRMFDKRFSQLLDQARTMKCSDPRDRVYAFLGHPWAQRLSWCGRRMSLKPDYSASVEQVCQQTTQILLSSEDVRVLSCVQHTDATLTDMDTPSWVVLWHVDTAQRGIASSTFPGCFRTTDLKSGPNDIGNCFREGGQVLALQAVIIDRVCEAWRVDCTSCIGTPFLDTEVIDSKGKHMSVQSLINVLARREDKQDRKSMAYTSKDLMRTFIADVPVPYLDLDGPVPSQGFFVTRDGLCQGQGGRHLILTENGYLGLAPHVTKLGDLCVAILGADVPFTVRPLSSEGSRGHSTMSFADANITNYSFRARLVGEIYIDGWMDGEVNKAVGTGNLHVKDIHVV